MKVSEGSEDMPDTALIMSYTPLRGGELALV